MKTKKKHRKGNLSSDRMLTRAKTMVMNSSDIFSTLSTLREEAFPGLYHDILHFTLSLARHRDVLVASALPRTIVELRSLPAPRPISIEREFRWASEYLALFAKYLSSFSTLSMAFESRLLRSEYDQSEKILNNIEEQFGLSLWLVKNKIAFLQLSQGLESQKKYASDIKQRTFRYGILPFITHYRSQLTEPSVTPQIFEKHFIEKLSMIQVPEWIKHYLRYHVTPIQNSSLDAILPILRYESTSSVIDYFEAMLDVSRMIIVMKQMHLYPTLIKTLEKIQKDVADPRISMILYSLGVDSVPQVKFDPLALETFDEYLSGHYDKAISSSYNRLLNQPYDFNTVEIAALSICASNNRVSEEEQSLLMRLLHNMSLVTKKGDDSSKAIADLVRISWVFSQNSWSKPLSAFLTKEAFPLSTGTVSGPAVYHLLSSHDLHPNNLRFFDNPTIIAKSISLLEQVSHNDSPSVSYCRKLNDPKYTQASFDKLIREEQTLISLNTCLQNCAFEEALETAKLLEKSKYDYYKNKSIQVISFSLLMLDRIEECIEYVTSTYLQNHNLHPILPINGLLEKIDQRTRKRLSHNISLPIVYDIFTKHFGPKYERFRNYSHEDFLFASGITRPSELRNYMNHFQKDKLIYFLRYVCVEQAMDCSTVYIGSQDLARERIEVCRILCEFDSINIDEYQSEIKDIHRRLTMKNKIREIERSKIYVDINGLKEIAHKNLEEHYSRYHSYIKKGMDPETYALRKSVEEKTAAGDIEGMLALSLPKNEINDLFESMILTLRDYFVSNPQHGLDAYLSVRIRHGTFTGQLRSPVEAIDLITQRDSTTGEYKVNSYWIDKLGIRDSRMRESLTNCFNSFSVNFDNLIQKMITEWIQVKTTKDGKGLFDFIVYKPYVAHISSMVTPDTTFDAFLDSVFNYFTEILNASLENIRHKINDEAKFECNNLVTKLQSQLIEICDDYYYIGELVGAINSTRTELQIAFDRVIEWFRLSNETGGEPYTIEDAINISVESMRASNPDFEVEMSISGDMKDTAIKGNLPSFVDVLFIIFGNIVKHSRVDGPLKAIVKVHRDQNFIFLQVLNDVAEGVAKDDNIKAINDIKKAMEKEDYTQAITTEGGTGFHKIKKILLHDFSSPATGAKPTLDFNFVDNTRFSVEISIPITFQQLNEENTLS